MHWVLLSNGVSCSSQDYITDIEVVSSGKVEESEVPGENHWLMVCIKKVKHIMYHSNHVSFNQRKHDCYSLNSSLLNCLIRTIGITWFHHEWIPLVHQSFIKIGRKIHRTYTYNTATSDWFPERLTTCSNISVNITCI